MPPSIAPHTHPPAGEAQGLDPLAPLEHLIQWCIGATLHVLLGGLLGLLAARIMRRRHLHWSWAAVALACVLLARASLAGAFVTLAAGRAYRRRSWPALASRRPRSRRRSRRDRRRSASPVRRPARRCRHRERLSPWSDRPPRRSSRRVGCAKADASLIAVDIAVAGSAETSWSLAETATVAPSRSSSAAPVAAPIRSSSVPPAPARPSPRRGSPRRRSLAAWRPSSSTPRAIARCATLPAAPRSGWPALRRVDARRSLRLQPLRPRQRNRDRRQGARR